MLDFRYRPSARSSDKSERTSGGWIVIFVLYCRAAIKGAHGAKVGVGAQTLCTAVRACISRLRGHFLVLSLSFSLQLFGAFLSWRRRERSIGFGLFGAHSSSQRTCWRLTQEDALFSKNIRETYTRGMHCRFYFYSRSCSSFNP